jgi:hypothetical protein
MAVNSAFDAVRSTPEFQKVFMDAEAGRAQAMVVVRQRGGEELLGRAATPVAA